MSSSPRTPNVVDLPKETATPDGDAPVNATETQGTEKPKLTAYQRANRKAKRLAREAEEAAQEEATGDKKKAQQKKSKAKSAQKKKAANVVNVRPMAEPAKMRRRHWGLVFSFIFHLLVPLAIVAWYLWDRAEDRYASTVGFTVQQEQGPSGAGALTDVFAQVGGGTLASDSNILFEFIQSQQLVQSIDAQFDLRGHYSQTWDTDPIFALSPDATLEELVHFWQRIVRIAFDESSGLMELRILANDPTTAQNIANAILERSQDLINSLNAQARADTIQYAEEDLQTAEDRLREARSELIRYRTTTQIVDPETDLAGRLGIVNTLQQQLANALVDYDLLAQSTSESDPRVVQAQSRIDVIRERLAEERNNVARGEESATGEDYPTLLAQYEELAVEREIAEQSYRSALLALDAARADAARQSRYLAAYIAPTLPQTAEYPQRMFLMFLISLFGLLAWSIVVLIYYSVRDTR